jgi:hypothetical protein
MSACCQAFGPQLTNCAGMGNRRGHQRYLAQKAASHRRTGVVLLWVTQVLPAKQRVKVLA